MGHSMKPASHLHRQGATPVQAAGNFLARPWHTVSTGPRHRQGHLTTHPRKTVQVCAPLGATAVVEGPVLEQSLSSRPSQDLYQNQLQSFALWDLDVTSDEDDWECSEWTEVIPDTRTEQEERPGALDSLQRLAMGLRMEDKIATAQAAEDALSTELTLLQRIDGAQLRRQLQDTQAHLEAVEKEHVAIRMDMHQLTDKLAEADAAVEALEQQLGFLQNLDALHLQRQLQDLQTRLEATEATREAAFGKWDATLAKAQQAQNQRLHAQAQLEAAQKLLQMCCQMLIMAQLSRNVLEAAFVSFAGMTGAPAPGQKSAEEK